MAGRERRTYDHNPLKTGRNNNLGKEPAEMDRGRREEEMHGENSGCEDRGGKIHLKNTSQIGGKKLRDAEHRWNSN